MGKCVADPDLHRDRGTEGRRSIGVDDQIDGAVANRRRAEPVVIAVNGDAGIVCASDGDVEAACEPAIFWGTSRLPNVI